MCTLLPITRAAVPEEKPSENVVSEVGRGFWENYEAMSSKLNERVVWVVVINLARVSEAGNCQSI